LPIVDLIRAARSTLTFDIFVKHTIKQSVPLVILWLSLLVAGNARAQSSLKSSPDIPTVDYCELLRRPELYDQRIVRVRTAYVRSGSERSTFNDSRCEQSGSTWVELDPPYESHTRRNLVRRLEMMERDSRPRPTKHNAGVIMITVLRAEVTFVGKFEATLPPRVGREHDFVDLDKVTDTKTAMELSTVKSDYAHHGKYQHLFTVQRVDEVKPISSKAPW
jgi:hypothetical protein